VWNPFSKVERNLVMDWAELNPDILHLIVKKLGDISNFVCFRATCKQWRSAAPTFDPPPQLPWFLSRHSDWKNKNYHQFYSLYLNKTQNIHLPLRGHEIWFGSSCQYVHIIDPPEELKHSYPMIHYKLLDPLTGSKIPMLFTESKVHTYLKDKNRMFRRHYIGPSHNLNPNFTSNGTEEVIGMLLERNVSRIFLVVLLLLNDRKETIISTTKHILRRKIVIYEPNSLITELVDATTGDKVVSQQRLEFSYLLEACGYVFGVVKHFKIIDLNTPMDQILFTVYRLEDYGTTPHWAEMKDGIGDLVLFLEYFSRSGVGFGLSASHFAGFKGNCIYFHEKSDRYIPDNRNIVGRFDIEKGITEVIPIKFPGVWFVPHL
jgi:Protein of unknown function (DUF295)